MSLRAMGTCSRLAARSIQYELWHARHLRRCWIMLYVLWPYANEANIAWPSNADAAWSIKGGRRLSAQCLLQSLRTLAFEFKCAQTQAHV